MKIILGMIFILKNYLSKYLKNKKCTIMKDVLNVDVKYSNRNFSVNKKISFERKWKSDGYRD